MTYHDASTRFGDRAHFPSMGSQLPKHIPGRGPGICLLEESQANPYGNRWFRGTWNSRYRKVGTAQFRMRICFLWGKLLGWFSFAKEKSRLVNQNYLQCSEFAEIYWYLFDCNLAEIYLTKIFAWLNWPWLVFHPWKSRCSTRIFFRILVVGIGRWNHSRQVMPWWPSRLLEGFFPESSYVFCRLFGGVQISHISNQGKLITLDMFAWKKKVAWNPFGWNYVESWNEFEHLAGMKQSPRHWRIPFHFEWHMSFNFWSTTAKNPAILNFRTSH